MAKGTKVKNEWDVIAESEIANVGQNIGKVIEAMGISQAQFAKSMNVAAGTLSSYISGGAYPPLDFIAKMCVVPDIQKAISFTADELLFETLEFNDGKPDADKKKSNLHSDILGNFFLYFYDQSSPDASGQIDSGRKLRYGIISIYEQVKKLGEIGVYAYALFFKTVEEAEIHWKDLISIDGADTHLDKLRMLYKSNNEHYTGEISFNGNHVFIDLSSAFYRDKGLFILNAPEKKPNADYIGGLGNALSLSHGSARCPVAQKIIFSRVQLKNASEEEIAKHLSLTSGSVSVQEETDEIIGLFKNLYPSGGAIGSIDTWFDEQDKRSIFSNRLSRLLQNRAEKEFNSLCMITKPDDHSVYKLIKRCMDSGM